ncbi:hypothetical protein CYCME_1436 [Cycloclasticus zancles 78-ME]|jgi:hypothetical protein|uniref:Uncharacterized protein n=1 Tax=Cycloclasticus zancles 78-ME TaxID=1198232 RepID=S5T847_9GAMM|nr:hypothetical protein CYCME_1436 [Cycloclasticus zancles 78-ME]
MCVRKRIGCLFEQAQLLATRWLWSYNAERSYKVVGGMRSKQLLKVV